MHRPAARAAAKLAATGAYTVTWLRLEPVDFPTAAAVDPAVCAAAAAAIAARCDAVLVAMGD
jgi:hypothetical protein